jgi:hypothetical protein
MLKIKFLCALLPLLLLLLIAQPENFAQQRNEGSALQSSYKLRVSVISAGGGSRASAGKKLHSTLGQVAQGTGSAGDMVLYSGYWGGFLDILVGVEEDIPTAYRNELFQNYPNPFNPITTIDYMLQREELVEIAIFNVNGQRVRVLERDHKAPGRYRVQWDGRNDKGMTVASGMYFYRLRAGGFTAVKKMLLIR